MKDLSWLDRIYKTEAFNDLQLKAMSKLSPRQQRMLEKLADFILPLHSQETGKQIYDIVEFVEAFLSAFDQSPPAIYAGGPFSGRHPLPGDPAPGNNFAQFLQLTRYQRLAWKLRIDGPDALVDEPFIALSEELKHNYTGLADIIFEGLNRAVAREDGMAPRPVMADDLLSETGPDFRTIFFPLLAQAAFSAPEYKSNRTAWQEIRYPGDSLPTGYKDAEVTQPDTGPDPFPITSLGKIFFDLAATFMGGRKFK